MYIAKANKSNLRTDERAELSLNPGSVVLFAISIFVLAAIVPDALNDVSTVNTTNFSAGTASLWGILPLVIVAGLLIMVLAFAGVTNGRGGGGV